jgi:antitoxin VapB
MPDRPAGARGGEVHRESLTEAVRTALAERLERKRRKRGRAPSLAERLDEIALHCASLPDYDTRTPEEIIGHDGHGVPR